MIGFWKINGYGFTHIAAIDVSSSISVRALMFILYIVLLICVIAIRCSENTLKKSAKGYQNSHVTGTYE
jgi:hypothetical protein